MTRDMGKDKDYRKLINSSRWLRLRRETLTRHPCCQDCEREGILTAATEVHHTRPVEEGLTLADKTERMFDPSNLRALCHDCHLKAHIAMGRTGKAAAKRISDAQTAAFWEKFFG